ncbi:HAD family hydrolase [Pseudolysinimonas sp.]|jgi:Cof subfamily protein (haloacid dehalogenase superfamily)|uniref:HAD family hydrolase n=1 Tax=Pseudolysinimonas sp. TaxID=2680009 RepID=UPI003783F044
MTSDRWLVGLDVDGTILHEDGTLTDALRDEIRRVRDLGHEVMIATGRSVSMTLPVLDQLGITPDYVVCANGAVVLRRDAAAPVGYARDHVETFDPTEVLTTIRSHLGDASYAVEDAEGVFRYTGHFPDGALAVSSRKVEFAELLDVAATRVVVISPGHAIEDFLAVVERMGLHKVTYNVGWTAWLDIAPDGVNKATGLERVRAALEIPASRVFTAGDGRNDIDMLEWTAAGGGVAVAMGQAPPEVIAAATETTGTDLDDGLAEALSRHFPGLGT